MNTGLLTFYHIHHYGAALQAAALTGEVERLGGTCEIIDYYVRQDNRLFHLPLTPNAAAADLHTALHLLPLRRRYQRFQSFLADRLRLTDRRYLTFEELQAAALPYDVLLCGSDQIWNPTIFPDGQLDPVFFGAFSPARKIAYAPSFGISHIPEKMRDTLKAYLSPFSHLSVREAAGQDIIQEMTGREAALALDPTLLPDGAAWEALSAYPAGYPEGAYILCYCISPPGVLTPYVRALARRTGLPVVQLCGTRRRVVPGARCILDAGPAEFLGLFRRAAAVVTNSFHGTAFSIQFHRPFFSAVSPRELSDPANARTYGLLQRLGLADRVAGTGETASIEAEIDWARVEGVLQAERANSRRYLADALAGRTYTPSTCTTANTAERDLFGQADAAQTVPAFGEADAISAQVQTDTPSAKHEPETAPPTAQREPPKLASRQDCTGCTACLNICPRSAITMERDREGFARPVVNLSACVHCGRCTAVCPPLQGRETDSPSPAVFAAWHRDGAVRRDSSSGGVFTAIGSYVLREGGVVFGAAMDGRQRVSHAACFHPEELAQLRGAKYVQSDLRETFRLVRQTLEKRPVLFVGTPCQVDGLYHYLGRRPDNLLTCDLVCHGVPSPGVWEDLVQSWRDQRGADVASVRFRDKAYQSPGRPDNQAGESPDTKTRDTNSQDTKGQDTKGQDTKGPSRQKCLTAAEKTGILSVAWEDGTVDSRPLYETEYGRAFGRSLFLRPCCHRCPYANLNRVGDFTLGDFWGLRPDELPEEQDRGVSLLLVNTQKASRVFDDLPIERRPFPVERAAAGNPNLSRPTPCPPIRAEFFAAYQLEPFEDVRRRYLTVPPLIVRKAKNLLSPLIDAVRKKR